MLGVLLFTKKALRVNIIEETDYWIIINKPAGLIVERHPQFRSLEQMVFEYFKKVKKKPFVGVVHRLDRPVSGAIIFAKKKSSLKKLNEMIRFREIKKTYLALVENKPLKEKGTLTHWLEKDKKNKRAVLHPTRTEKGKQAILKYELKKEHKNGFLLKINLTTGRYHQIRAQLAELGCPIIGDEKYGSAASFAENTIGLHAWRLEFECPFSERKIEVEAEVPF